MFNMYKPSKLMTETPCAKGGSIPFSAFTETSSEELQARIKRLAEMKEARKSLEDAADAEVAEIITKAIAELKKEKAAPKPK